MIVEEKERGYCQGFRDYNVGIYEPMVGDVNKDYIEGYEIGYEEARLEDEDFS